MKRIIKPIFLAAFSLLLFSATNAHAQVNQSNYRLRFAKGKTSVSQSRSIKKDVIRVETDKATKYTLTVSIK
jgi:hypothetical protein